MKISIKEIRDKFVYSESDTWYARIVCRKFSPYFTWFFVRTSILPNQVTLLMILWGIVGGIFLAFPGYANGLLGVIFLQLFLIFDCVDGEVARVKKIFSYKGKFLDLIANDTTLVSIFIGLAFRELSLSQNFTFVAMVFIAVILLLLSRSFSLYANGTNEKLSGRHINSIILNTSLKLTAYQIVKNLILPPTIILILTLAAALNVLSCFLVFYGIFFIFYFFVSLVSRFIIINN